MRVRLRPALQSGVRRSRGEAQRHMAARSHCFGRGRKQCGCTWGKCRQKGARMSMPRDRSRQSSCCASGERLGAMRLLSPRVVPGVGLNARRPRRRGPGDRRADRGPGAAIVARLGLRLAAQCGQPVCRWVRVRGCWGEGRGRTIAAGGGGGVDVTSSADRPLCFQARSWGPNAFGPGRRNPLF